MTTEYNKNKLQLWAEKAYSPAYIIILMLITMIIVMLMYTIFNDFITTVFYNMAMGFGVSDSTSGIALFDYMVWMWEYFIPIGFVLSLVIWAVVNSMREENIR